MSKRAKKWLIAATSLILIGCILFVGVMTMLNWNFKKLSTDKYETNTHAVTEAFTNLSITVDTADIVFAPSKDNTVSVVCYEETKTKHVVVVEGDTLVIKVAKEVKWYQRLGFHIEGPKITVYLPADTYGTLKIKATTGDVTIPKDFSFACADVTVTTGDITCSADVAEAMTLHVTTGDIKLSSVACGNLTLGVTTGDADLSNVTCRTLTSTGTTGDITLRNVVATGSFSIKRGTGDVRFDACDAAALTVKTTTGDITGTLLTAKMFDAHATTGRVSVPQSSTGGKCKLNATTGHIEISVL